MVLLGGSSVCAQASSSAWALSAELCGVQAMRGACLGHCGPDWVPCCSQLGVSRAVLRLHRHVVGAVGVSRAHVPCVVCALHAVATVSTSGVAARPGCVSLLYDGRGPLLALCVAAAAFPRCHVWTFFGSRQLQRCLGFTQGPQGFVCCCGSTEGLGCPPWGCWCVGPCLSAVFRLVVLLSRACSRQSLSGCCIAMLLHSCILCTLASPVAL